MAEDTRNERDAARNGFNVIRGRLQNVVGRLSASTRPPPVAGNSYRRRSEDMDSEEFLRADAETTPQADITPPEHEDRAEIYKRKWLRTEEKYKLAAEEREMLQQSLTKLSKKYKSHECKVPPELQELKQEVVTIKHSRDQALRQHSIAETVLASTKRELEETKHRLGVEIASRDTAASSDLTKLKRDAAAYKSDYDRAMRAKKRLEDDAQITA